MNYNEFRDELFRVIAQQEEVKDKKVFLLEKGFTTDDSQMLSMIRYINRVSFGIDTDIMQGDFIQIIWGEGSIRSMMSWDVGEYFEKYQNDGWQTVLPELMVKIKKAGCTTDWLHLGPEGYALSRDRLILRPINYENNRYELENCIFRKFGDIALTLYGLVCDNEDDYVTMKINREISRSWGVPDEELLDCAMKNTSETMPPRLFYCTDLRGRHEEAEGWFMTEEAEKYDKYKMTEIHLESEMEGTLGYRLTTTKNVNGAIALFYPGVQERLGELLEGDYLVGFTSIHEAVLHPIRKQTAQSIKDSIEDVNRAFPREEMLSGKVFQYSRIMRTLVEV